MKSVISLVKLCVVTVFGALRVHAQNNGPFLLGTDEYPTSYYDDPVFMFDVEAINDVLLTSITLQLANKAAQSFTMYTATGGFDDKYQNETLWTKVFGPVTGTTPGQRFEVTIDFNDTAVSAGSVQSFYIHATGGTVASPLSTNDPLVSDNNLKILTLAKGSLALWGSFVPRDMSFAGNITYFLNEPTVSPSSSPTVSPSANPTVSPSQSPSNSPSVSPSLSPSTAPPTSPTIPPTAQCGNFGDPCELLTDDPFGFGTCCFGFVCGEDEFGELVCGSGEDEGSYSPTSSPVVSPTTNSPTSFPTTSSPVVNPTTNSPTSLPTASKSTKSSKSSKASPSPSDPAPKSSKGTKVVGQSGFSF